MQTPLEQLAIAARNVLNNRTNEHMERYRDAYRTAYQDLRHEAPDEVTIDIVTHFALENARTAAPGLNLRLLADAFRTHIDAQHREPGLAEQPAPEYPETPPLSDDEEEEPEYRRRGPIR